MTPLDAGLLLVVDDNEFARYSKARTLRQAGYEVIESATGTDAIRQAQEHAPRVVILDVHLPDVSGLEVCRRLKEHPSTATMLVLQVSATHVHDEDMVRALEGGADASLAEPVDPTVLVATVRALLRTRRAEDALREALAREQTAREAAESANRSKDEFLATLSHELRSPLGAILTWVTLLRSRRIDEVHTARALEAIERNTRLQVRMIEELLDVSRIVSGKMRLEPELVDLAAAVDGALESIRSAADAKAIRLEAIVDPALGPVSGDAARLQQVVWNLLSNAVKFTPRDGRVEVRLTAVESQAELRVTDSGVGIDPAFLPHLFERFRQADSSSTRVQGGLGLGLAIVRHLVELHGGTVRAANADDGTGAIFTVRLPLPAVRPVGSGSPGRAAHLRERNAPPPSLAGLHVLVLDDQRDARDGIAAVLESGGARVTVAGTVREALAAMRDDAVDVVVSDIAMPAEDGYDFLRRTRALPAGRGDTPVLALTAYASATEQRRIQAAGFDGYLAKPVDAVELAAAVERLATRRASG